MKTKFNEFLNENTSNGNEVISFLKEKMMQKNNQY